MPDDEPWDAEGVDPELLRITQQNFNDAVEAYGPRLRKQSRDQMRMAHQALLHDAGGVMVQIVPPGTTDPIEIRFYPYGTKIQILGETFG